MDHAGDALQIANTPPKRPGIPGARRWWLTLLGVVSTGTATACFSSDWGCLTVGMGLLGAIIARFEQEAAKMNWARSYRNRRGLRALCIVTLGIATSLPFLWDQARVFEIVFGVRPPAELRELTAERFYNGGPGDDAILIRFIADEATMRGLLSARSFEDVLDILQDYPANESWAQLWDRKFLSPGPGSRSEKWKSCPAMHSPKAFSLDERAGSRRTVLLWDESTGQVYVASHRG